MEDTAGRRRERSIPAVNGVSEAEQAGGQYVVAWGAMLFGAIRFVMGMTRSQRARQE